jgi:hypothetical protein
VLGWLKVQCRPCSLTRIVADLVFPFATPPHHPAPPPDTRTDAPATSTRSRNTIHGEKECIDKRNTYHQLDLLGRAAVGGRGCRVGCFALAAGVHGCALRRAIMKRDSRAIVIPSARTVCDRGVSDERVDVTLTNTVIHLLQVKHARDVNYARPSAAAAPSASWLHQRTRKRWGGPTNFTTCTTLVASFVLHTHHIISHELPATRYCYKSCNTKAPLGDLHCNKTNTNSSL